MEACVARFVVGARYLTENVKTTVNKDRGFIQIPN